MNFSLFKQSFCFAFIFALLIGCSSPNTTPESVSTQPLTDGQTAIRAESGPMTMIPPKGYWVANNQEGVSISGTGEAGSMLIGIQINSTSGQSADVLIENYMSELPAGWNRLIEDEAIGGLSGRGSRYSLEADAGEFLTGRVIAITTAARDYLLFAVMNQDDWISQGSADFSQMLSLIEIDDADAPQVNLPDAPDTDEAQVDIPVPATPAPTPTAVPPITSIPPFSGQSADGYACFGGFDTGLNCIDPTGGWLHYTNENSSLKNNSIFNMTACPDGRILIINVTRLTVFDGTDFVNIELPEDFSLPDLVGCGPDGDMWLAHYRGVSVYRSGQWEFFEKEDIVIDTETVFQGLEIAPDGTAWIISFNEVASLAPTQTIWTIFADGEGLDDQYFFDGLSLDRTGTPYISHSGGYIWFDGDEWQEKDADSGFFGDLEVGVDQQVYLTSYSSGLLISNLNEDLITNQTTADGLSRNDLDLIESDEQGRVWVTTETGVDIFDGAAWTSLNMGNSELVHNRFQGIVVIGSGPQLPQTEQEPSGKLTGKLIKGGSPLTDLSVTICLDGYIPYNEPGTNPCLASVESFTVQTDATGVFLFEDVPSGWYELFFSRSGVWQELEDENGILTELVLIESGETIDLGEINPE